MKHIRKVLLAILVLLVTLPCVTSGFAATRYIGYLNKDTYVYQKASKSSTSSSIPAPLFLATTVFDGQPQFRLIS